MQIKPKRRTFTRLEDEMIIAQTQGKMSFTQLMRYCQTGSEQLRWRAQELGVQLQVKTAPERRRYSQPREQPLLLTDTLEPSRIRDDKLLKRLFELYPIRRYNSSEQDYEAFV